MSSRQSRTLSQRASEPACGLLRLAGVGYAGRDRRAVTGTGFLPPLPAKSDLARQQLTPEAQTWFQMQAPLLQALSASLQETRITGRPRRRLREMARDRLH